MTQETHLPTHTHKLGLTSSDSYTAAWISLVPNKELSGPAWPAALEYVRSHQLEDGGWGDAHIYHAHDRVMSTLAALWALAEWHQEPEDERRIAQGVDALHRYADDLQKEPYETIGFELILPRLAEAVAEFGMPIPKKPFALVKKDTTRKLARVGRLNLNDGEPKSWWFSAEGLSEERLASIEDTINLYGGFGCVPSATAACLRALRRHGRDSQPAFDYIDKLVDRGGVCHLYPTDNFEIAWTLDAYRRAQIDASSNTDLVLDLAERWNSQCGLGASSAFPVPDGDTTAVAYTVLYWAATNHSCNSGETTHSSPFLLNTKAPYQPMFTR